MGLTNENVTVEDGYKHTYVAAFNVFSASSTTDVWELKGSATKTVTLLRIGISATRTTLSAINLQLVKRSSANTGGFSVPPALGIIPFNPDAPAATATTVFYSSAPTVGSLVGIIRAIKFNINDTTPTLTSQPQYIFDFNRCPHQAITIRGTSELVAINLLGQTVLGMTGRIWVEWTEE